MPNDNDPHGEASAGRALDRFLVLADIRDKIRKRNKDKRIGSNRPTEDELSEERDAEAQYAVVRDTLPGRKNKQREHSVA